MSALLCAAGLSHADSCSYQTKIRYPDGQEGCLSELPIASKISKVWGTTINKAAQFSSFYVIAAGSSCSNVEIFSTNHSLGSMVQNLKSGILSQAENYIAACPKECDCRIVVNDGKVLLPRNAAMALGGGDTKTTLANSQTQAKDHLNAEKALTEAPPSKERLPQQSEQLTSEVEALRIKPKFEETRDKERNAQSCSFRTKILYPDGQAGCLGDLPLASKISPSWGRTIDQAAQSASYYLVVAASSCSNAEIFLSNNNQPAQVLMLKDGIVRNAEKYIAACPKECDCTVVINDGKALLPRSLAMALGGDGAKATPLNNQAQAQNRLNADKALTEEALRKERLAQQTQALQREQQLGLQKSQEQAKSDQDERRKDRELLLQLSNELTRLRVEAAAAAAAAAVKAAAAAPAAIPAAPSVAEVLPPEPIYANRKALVIGNDSYKVVTKLENAREDARLMAKSLTNVGYQVTLKLDLTEKEMKAALRSFKNQVDAGDEVAIFYAGHGVQLANSNYLIPIDVAGQDVDQIKDEGIALQRLLDDMTDKKVKFTLAMIDACRDNPFKNNGRAIGGGLRGLAPTTAATGQMVVFSAGSGQQALDKLGPSDPDKNGLFTRIFAKEMQKPNVTIDRVVRSVRTEVVKLARSVGHDQVPAIYDQVVGEFYFRR